MSDTLYSLAVLRLAAEAKGAGRLKTPDASYTEHNPACGDRSTVDLRIDGDRITAMAHDTRACVFAQASASILAGHLIGLGKTELDQLRDDVLRMLDRGMAPGGAFARYADLKEVAGVPGRHRCVLLPIDAARNALSALKPPEPGTEWSKP